VIERDPHTEAAAAILGIPKDQVTPEQRGRAKAIRFGAEYGSSPAVLAAKFGLSDADVRRLRAKFSQWFVKGD